MIIWVTTITINIIANFAITKTIPIQVITSYIVIININTTISIIIYILPRFSWIPRIIVIQITVRFSRLPNTITQVCEFFRIIPNTITIFISELNDISIQNLIGFRIIPNPVIININKRFSLVPNPIPYIDEGFKGIKGVKNKEFRFYQSITCHDIFQIPELCSESIIRLHIFRILGQKSIRKRDPIILFINYLCRVDYFKKDTSSGCSAYMFNEIIFNMTWYISGGRLCGECFYHVGTHFKIPC